MIKTILFDIGGVVTHTDFPSLYAHFAARIGVSPEYVRTYHETHFAEMLVGKITLEQFWNDLKNAGANPQADFKKIWIEEALKIRKIDNDVIELIATLRKKYKVGTLSNLTVTRKMIDEEIQLYEHFDIVVLSCVEGVKKPDPRIYEIALSRAGVSPNEVIFVDDQQKCTLPAEALGIKTVLFENTAQCIEKLKNLGVTI